MEYEIESGGETIDCPDCGKGFTLPDPCAAARMKASHSQSTTPKCPFCAEEILKDAIKCKHCGETIPDPDAEGDVTAFSLLRLLGVMAMLSGICGALFFLLVFDPSIEVPQITVFGQAIGGGRVNNIGLLKDSQNGMIFSLVMVIFGFGMIVLAGSKSKPPKPHVKKRRANKWANLLFFFLVLVGSIMSLLLNPWLAHDNPYLVYGLFVAIMLLTIAGIRDVAKRWNKKSPTR